MPVTAACGRRRVPPPPQRRDPSPAVQHSVRLQQSPGHARSLRLYAWPCGRAVSVAWCGSQARLCARFGRLWALICELLGSFVRMQILLPQSGLRRPVPRRGGSPQQRLPGRPPRSGGTFADAEHTGSAPPPLQDSRTRLCVFARAAAKPSTRTSSAEALSRMQSRLAPHCSRRCFSRAAHACVAQRIKNASTQNVPACLLRQAGPPFSQLYRH